MFPSIIMRFRFISTQTRDVQAEWNNSTAITSDYSPNHNQTGSTLSVTGLISNGVLVRDLIMIAVCRLRWNEVFVKHISLR